VLTVNNANDSPKPLKLFITVILKNFNAKEIKRYATKQLQNIVLVKFSCLWMRKNTTYHEIRILLSQFCCKWLFGNGKLTYTTQSKPYL
jgi:hypothetical protein